MPRKSNKHTAASSGPIAMKLPESRGVRKAKTEIPNVSWKNRLSELSTDEWPIDNATRILLEGCTETRVVAPRVLADRLIRISNDFPLPFPVNTVRTSNLLDRFHCSLLEWNINSAYPLIHEDTLPLIANWLEHKREHGSAVEKTLYEEMGLIEFVQRLLECRAFSFFGRKDNYKILEVEHGHGGWEKIGTDLEQPPLVLKNYLSYDEIKLSALLAMSSNSQYINDGSLNNNGVWEPNSYKLQDRGVSLGIVQPRFQRAGVMEYQDIVIAKDQNTVENGYGKPSKASPDAQITTGLHDLRRVWAQFYDEPYFPLYEEVSERIRREPGDPKYVPVREKYIFDAEIYLKRTLITVEMILLETNGRGKEGNDMTYLHVHGFGLEAEKAVPQQEIYVLKAFEIALKKMMTSLSQLSDIVFSNFPKQSKCGGVANGGRIGHINIHFGKNQPHINLNSRGGRTVITYPWDANAYPGNEFWMGDLGRSRASAVACSSQIAELQNVKINPCASATNLRIASPEHGILHIADYAKLKL